MRPPNTSLFVRNVPDYARLVGTSVYQQGILGIKLQSKLKVKKFSKLEHSLVRASK